MIRLTELHNKYTYRPAAVLGGGPSLQSDFGHLSSFVSPVIVAVNHHAQEIGIRPDIVVYMDRAEDFPDLARNLQGFDGLKFSPKSGQVDYDVPIWDGGFSSTVACWLACFMGCDPVLLCGMDCYLGDNVYCHPFEGRVPAQDNPIENHLNAWRDALKYCQNPERIRAMSGPLVEIFGKMEGNYD